MVDTIVGEDDPEAVEMICSKCGISGISPGGRVIGFRDKDGIRGVFYCERYTGVNGSIHLHWAGRGGQWLKPYMMTLVSMYIFDQLKCQICYGEVSSEDSAVRKIDERLGFIEVAKLSGYFPSADLIIYQMRKAECVWLPNEFKDEEDGERRSA